jgi:hypothetical protein
MATPVLRVPGAGFFAFLPGSPLVGGSWQCWVRAAAVAISASPLGTSTPGGGAGCVAAVPVTHSYVDPLHQGSALTAL